MIAWPTQSPEERALLAPSFTATLLWSAGSGHQAETGRGLPFETCFLVLPLVLHGGTRESLPRSATTSLAVWLDDHPMVSARIAERGRKLVPFTREAIIFGGSFDMFTVTLTELSVDVRWKKKIETGLKKTNDEVRICVKRAEFLGKWLAKAGSGTTIMALLGVRP